MWGGSPCAYLGFVVPLFLPPSSKLRIVKQGLDISILQEH